MNVDNGGYVNMQAAEMTVKNTAEMNVDSGGHVNMQAAEMTEEVTTEMKACSEDYSGDECRQRRLR